jgi:protein involved in polysaccharide export with SLBB domain
MRALKRAICAGLFVGLAVVPAASVTAAASAQETAAPVSAPKVKAGLADYRLGPGDKVRVIVYGEQDLTGEYFVSGAGTVSLPLIGILSVSGHTLDQFKADVEDAYRKGYLKDPSVAVEVLSYRPFYILGEVNKPGEYPYTNALTVLNAVATAEGFTYRANTRVVFIKHAREKVEHKEKLTSDAPVEPGDTIRIAERFF